MLEKLKEMFKDKERRIQNLVFLLALLIITLLAINYILSDDESEESQIPAGAELADADDVSSSLEARIENILSQISGVGEVSVLITYENEELEGTVVVSEGAGSAKVKSDIVNAVEAVTGLSKHKIQVYTMKESENANSN